MGFRRGFLLGLLAGIVGAVMGGRPSADEGASGGPAAGGGHEGGSGSLLDEVRAAAQAERTAAEARMEERFRVARQTGRMPEERS